MKRGSSLRFFFVSETHDHGFMSKTHTNDNEVNLIYII